MSSNDYDLIIVGAGPAGLGLARAMAHTRRPILVLDRKPYAQKVRYHSSGTFMNPAEYGLPESIFHSLESIVYSSKNRQVTKTGIARVIDRPKMQEVLEDQALQNPNLEIAYSAHLTDIQADDNGRILSLRYRKDNRQRKVTATFCADCTGPNASLGRRTRLVPARPLKAVGIEYLVPLTAESETADLFVGSHFEGGYGWVFPKSADTAIVGYGTLAGHLFGKLEDRLKDMWKLPRISDRCKLEPIEKHVAPLRTGAPLEKYSKANLLVVGDSALQANPVAGEGIRFALDAAALAGRALTKALESGDESCLKEYDGAWTKKYFKKYQLGYRLQQRIARASRDDAKLDFAVGKLEHVSNKDFVRLLSGDLTKTFLFKLGAKAALKLTSFR